MKNKVLVAMSGGVDSSVSAFLLKEEGYEVIGVTMCLGITPDEDTPVKCCGRQAIQDAKKVCDKLNIPHYVLNFSRELEETVIKNFVEEYLRGRTPNPCIECNRSLKFDKLLKSTLSFGCDFLATGHYARIEKYDDNFLLKKPKDTAKDQTYFLYTIKKESLKFIKFPLADLYKDEVRSIAKKIELPVANKPQSQDICFIPGKDYRKFLISRIGDIKSGDIVDLKGNILGKHKGIIFYTIGQREGIGISAKKPFYVVSIDATKNQIIVGTKEDLNTKELIAGNLNFIVDEIPEKATAKIRYSRRESECNLVLNNDKCRVIFKEGQEAITPGQSIIFYKNDIVLGGGIIEEVLR